LTPLCSIGAIQIGALEGPATLLKAGSGTATVSGLDVAAQPAKVRGAISLAGQFAAVDEILTGRENLIMIAGLRRVEGAAKVADGLLARFGLADAAGRRVALAYRRKIA
jgi:ABC-2 type transport system ATP-binding protein